ncbi:cobalamin biosynthesis protein [Sphingomonas sp. S-NIH.Pt15_0812]|uniref:cobalamin biosynthesis protein n=1 Tax=Sphingomonas sp. S-NIH.Pt15_0812 TaxID=1920129 RepID=UPI001F4A0181|nr:cobalamin biosynthesis protein [Sphingomonas sp. S-NIH.Pt15_0812]
MERSAVIVAGFGGRAAATAAAYADALAGAWGGGRIDALAAPADRCAALAPLAATLGLPLLALSPEMLEGRATPTRSAISLARRGTGSVAEAAALAGAGPGARLLRPRHIATDRTATCAIAQRRPS